MVWEYLRPGQLNKIRKSIDWAVKNAKAHEDHLGDTEDKKEKSKKHFSKKMKKSKNDNQRYLRILRDKYEVNGTDLGDAWLMFQKMKWMSQYGKQWNWKQIWILTIVFEETVLPLNGPDADYEAFLNHISGEDGPMRIFLDDENIESLFVVGPKNPNEPQKTKRIGQLEIVARNLFGGGGGDWTIQDPPVTIDSSYKGVDSSGNDVPIPQTPRGGVLGFWGKHTGNEFDLTEIKFTG